MCCGKLSFGDGGLFVSSPETASFLGEAILRKFLLATAAFFSLAGAAQASVIPILESVSDAGGGLFLFTYQANLAPDAGLMTGSQFVIFDFAGYDLGSLLSADPRFTATVQNSTPGYSLPPGFSDDAGIANLVFTWNAVSFQTTGGPFAPTPFTVSARSTYSGTAMGGFGAFTVTNNGPAQGALALNSGSTAVPLVFTGGVPEPASWAMMIVGFACVGALMRRRRQGMAVI